MGGFKKGAGTLRRSLFTRLSRAKREVNVELIGTLCSRLLPTLSPEIYLGRRVQGPVNVDPDLAAYVEAVANFGALDCSNNPSPYITVDWRSVWSACVFSAAFPSQATIR